MFLLKTTSDEWREGPKPRQPLNTDNFSNFVDLAHLHPSPYVIASDWKVEHINQGGRHNRIGFIAVNNHIMCPSTADIKTIFDFGDGVVDAPYTGEAFLSPPEDGQRNITNLFDISDSVFRFLITAGGRK